MISSKTKYCVAFESSLGYNSEILSTHDFTLRRFQIQLLVNEKRRLVYDKQLTNKTRCIKTTIKH